MVSPLLDGQRRNSSSGRRCRSNHLASASSGGAVIKDAKPQPSGPAKLGNVDHHDIGGLGADEARIRSIGSPPVALKPRRCAPPQSAAGPQRRKTGNLTTASATGDGLGPLASLCTSLRV